MNQLTSYTCKLTDAQAEQLREQLQRRGFVFRDVPHAVFAAEAPGLTVTFYRSGKLLVQGRGTTDFVLYVLEPEILKEARLGYESVLNPELVMPRIGIDESGKGDYFGPLCVAAVYVNERIIRAWQGHGIRDSKNVTSDARLLELARLIRGTPGVVHEIVEIGNQAYNRLYSKLGNVNLVLAWAHGRVLRDMLAKRHLMDPIPVRAISDQFATNKAVLEKAMQGVSEAIEFVQKHKAEDDVAVAAASILARARFISRLRRLGAAYGITFPPGASGAVVEAARQFVARYGAEALAKVAKLHFRTTAAVLSGSLSVPSTDQSGADEKGSPAPESEETSHGDGG